MPPSAVNPVQQYILAMRTAHSFGANTAETTFYTPLANLLNAVGERLSPRVCFQAHPGSHGAGLADGGLFPLARKSQREPLPGQLPERGAVEIKAPGASLATLGQSAQVRRYLETYGLCLITNYHQFQLLELLHGQPHILESYDLAATAEALWSEPAGTLAGQHEQTLSDFLQRVMIRKVPLEKPKNVAWLLASYAREARTRASAHPLAAFDGVKSALQESLGITFEGDKGEHFFLSTLIQTLFYGIFSAWILWRRTPEGRALNTVFNWRLSATYLRIPVLRALFHAVTEPGALDTVQVVEMLDRASDALNRVEPGFFVTFNDEDAVNYFYEPFLEAFDPELRKQLGVWYTPRGIVRYMVERVDHLLRTELNEPLGLASSNVQVLDPCCGTGAYLVEVLHSIERTLREQARDDDALVSSDLRRAATTRIFGFEIMPAPFVVAHLQLANLLEKAGASLGQAQRAQVFLTNALTGWVPVRHPQSRFGFPAFAEERDAAESVKQADTILVILGNPPYNGYAGIAMTGTSEASREERDLTLAYASSVLGLPAPQGQGLNDLYIRFFRIAERRITQNRDHRGIVSLISNYSWLEGLSHPTMRHHLLGTFDNIYIDNLHGDRRISEYAPDGRTSETVFAMPGSSVGIKVGVAITTLVKAGEGAAARTIHYRDFTAARAEQRRRELQRSTHGSPFYAEITPIAGLGLPFKPREITKEYLGWPRITDILPIFFAGVQTKRDPLIIDISPVALRQKVENYLNPLRTDEQIRKELPCAMQVTARFAPIETRQVLSQAGFKPWQIVRDVYRPFDARWMYWEPTTRLLGEKSPEYVRKFAGGLSLILPRQNRVAYGGPLIARTLVDLNVVDGGAAVFPLQTAEESLLSDQSLQDNCSLRAASWIASTSTKHGDLVLHVLSVTHTPRYATENEGALHRDWPRIPLPATGDLLHRSASLGHRLAELLDPDSDLRLLAEWSFLARLILPPELPEGSPARDRRNAARIALTAGWGGPGQGASVMPRRGDARERPWTSTEIDRIATLAATQSLAREAALDLLGPRCVDVYLNSEALWAAVPLHVWNYTLGGYQVLKKWLSYREEPLLGRPLHEEEARYFAQVVRRIAAILFLGPALDASYAAILPNATGLPE